jgi:hypothetical protein
MPEDDEKFRISHDDVGKRRVDYDPELDFGGKSEFDIEGEDDLPPVLKEHDLREFKYGVIRKFQFSFDDQVNLRKVRYIFRELLIELGLGRFNWWYLLTSAFIVLLALFS